MTIALPIFDIDIDSLSLEKSVQNFDHIYFIIAR